MYNVRMYILIGIVLGITELKEDFILNGLLITVDGRRYLILF